LSKNSVQGFLNGLRAVFGWGPSQPMGECGRNAKLAADLPVAESLVAEVAHRGGVHVSGRPSQPCAQRPGPRLSPTDALPVDPAPELSHHSHHVKHEIPALCQSVDLLVDEGRRRTALSDVVKHSGQLAL